MTKKSHRSGEDQFRIDLPHTHEVLDAALRVLHDWVGKDLATRQEIRDALRTIPAARRRRLCKELAFCSGVIALDATEVAREMDD